MTFYLPWKALSQGISPAWFEKLLTLHQAFGPFIGGIIVTYSSWRMIFWLQTALAAVSAFGVIFLVPETSHQRRSTELTGLSRKEKARKLASWLNPWRAIVHFRTPNILAVGLAASSLVWNM
jgi:predicted MFS family arabinose efflux permease